MTPREESSRRLDSHADERRRPRTARELPDAAGNAQREARRHAAPSRRRPHARGPRPAAQPAIRSGDAVRPPHGRRGRRARRQRSSRARSCAGCRGPRHAAPSMPAPAGDTHRSAWRARRTSTGRPTRTTSPAWPGMVAYNLLLSVFPLALLALFIAGPGARERRPRGQRAPGPAAAVPDARPTTRSPTRSTASATPRPASASWRWWRASGSARRSGARSTPRSAASTTCAAAAGSSRSASRSRCSWSCCCSWRRPWRCRRSRACCVSSADDLPLGLSDVDGPHLRASRCVAGLLLLFAVLCLIYWAVPEPARSRGGRSGRARSAATVAIGIVDYAFPAYLSNDLHDRPVRHDLRVRPDRADLVLRARDHPPRRRDHQRHALRDPRHRRTPTPGRQSGDTS